MMDFDGAADRLAQDHSKLRARYNRNKKGLHVSSKTQKEVEYRKRQYELKKQRLVLQKEKEYAGQLVMQKCQAKFVDVGGGIGVSSSFQKKIFTECTSIHGQGDKIALPSSILEEVADLLFQNNNNNSNSSNNPMYFRVGIRNPDYSFPASDGMKAYMEQFVSTTNTNINAIRDDTNNTSMEEDEDDDDDDDDDEDSGWMAQIYLEELSHQYYTYTHSTVVEFTQEEGCIGLPQSIASALLDPRRLLCHRPDQKQQKQPLIESISNTQTVDPATTSMSLLSKEDENEDVNSANNTVDVVVIEGEEGTPGHVAYGAFRVPNVPVELTLVRHLPKGKKCTLLPTQQAIDDGFYNLNNVKLVLEQSLIRTRATLTLGDEISTWHRGKRYNLSVTHLEPNTLGVVSCINTDLEIDFASPPNYHHQTDDDDDDNDDDNDNPSNKHKINLPNDKNNATNTDEIMKGEGYRLGGRNYNKINHADNVTSNENTKNQEIVGKNTTTTITATNFIKVELLPEPPISASNVSTIQIRSFDGTRNKRRFDIQTNTMKNVFDFASNHCGLPSQDFRLVTRFPKRIFTSKDNMNDDNDNNADDPSMAQFHFGKQEMIFIERI